MRGFPMAPRASQRWSSVSRKIMFGFGVSFLLHEKNRERNISRKEAGIRKFLYIVFIITLWISKIRNLNDNYYMTD